MSIFVSIFDFLRRRPPDPDPIIGSVTPPEPERLTLADYWMQRDADARYADELTSDIRAAAGDLVSRVNTLLTLRGSEATPKVNSGWRPRAVNAAIGGAPNSRHLIGKAIDLDDDGLLAAWCLRNLPALESTGLWLENPHFTRGWVHLQSEAPRSGSRVFIP